MRHRIDRCELFQHRRFSSLPKRCSTPDTATPVTSSPDAETQPEGESLSSGGLSLKGMLSRARFFSGEDVSFTGIAASAAEARQGELVVYRIGIDDPMDVVSQALARGAAGVLTEQVLPAPIPQCIVPDTDAALGEVQTHLYGRPDRRLITIGVTGSAGKSTTAAMLTAILRDIPARVACHSDLCESDGVVDETGCFERVTHTTLVQRIASDVDADAAVSVIELDADALQNGGYERVSFDILVANAPATGNDNFGPTPIDAAVERLDRQGVLICRHDDAAARQAANNAGAVVCTFGVDTQAADVSIATVDHQHGTLTGLIRYRGSSAVMETDIAAGLLLDSLAAAAAVGVVTENPLTQIAETFSKPLAIPGRCHRLIPAADAPAGRPTVIADVAGCPDRAAHVLKQIKTAMRRERPATLSLVRPHQESRGKLWCVLAVPAGDDAETLARYGRVLESLPDEVVLTCVPDDKVEFLRLGHGVLDGVQNCAALRLVADRARAVTWAVEEAAPEDTVLVLGDLDKLAPDQSHVSLESWLSEVLRTIPETQDQPASLKLFPAG